MRSLHDEIDLYVYTTCAICERFLVFPMLLTMQFVL